jgi:RHS repeat-associated protein
LAILLLSYCCSGTAGAQTFNFKTSEASSKLTASDIANHLPAPFPDTITVWCNEWNTIQLNPATWGNTMKLKSNNTFVKFYIDNYYPELQLPYTYQLSYQIYGYTSADTTPTGPYVLTTDTLTITNPDMSDMHNAYQDIQMAKYSNYYKAIVILTGMYLYDAGTSTFVPLSATNIADTLKWNYNVEASILTQQYDKTNYGAGSSLTTTAVPNVADNYLNVYFAPSTGPAVTPVNYELEWTYVDDYQRDLSTGDISAISPSDLNYDFNYNNTRVWIDSANYRIPLVYPSGYIIYRARMVRPDTNLYQYPVYSDWSTGTGSGAMADNGNVSGLSTGYYHITAPYAHDSINWQYTVSFAEGGKYKHVLSFYDGLLKNRESITRFNSNPNKLIVTKNIYDFEGRPSIKTLPAPVSATSFSYQHNVDLNSATGQPYKAADFDTGFSLCPGIQVLSPLSSTALASVYYSNQNPDTAGVQKFVPDAGGYPLVETVYDPAFNDRIDKQGGAGPRLQLADSNVISNYYVGSMQADINRLFGLNVGWSSYYNMTVTRDPNMQLSMSIKNYEGKQIASSMIGSGPNPVDHAITAINVPDAVYYHQDILQGAPQEVIGNTRIADKDFFNEVEGNDSLQYIYQFTPYPVCDKYLSVKAHYYYRVTDQCGDTILTQDSTLGITGVVTSPVAFSGSVEEIHVGVEQYSVHKELTINTGDIYAAVDSFFASDPSCVLTEPYFIRKSVESRNFPCPTVITDPCALKKKQMEQDLHPGAKYGHFTASGTTIVGTSNSIFTVVISPIHGVPNHYRYQDTCTDYTFPDTMTINGYTYTNMRTMSADSFIMIYNSSITDTSDPIAEALLPLHPEYCELKNCFVDTFKVTLEALPNAHVAQNLGLLYMDSIIAHDPLRSLVSPDSLSTYPGGHVRLDYMEYIKDYCGCGDSVMLKTCVNSVFSNEINNRLLVNDYVKNAYFGDMIGVYLNNRQRFVDLLSSSAGDSCSHCALARMTLVPSPVFPPATPTSGTTPPVMYDSAFAGGSSTGTWLVAAMSSSLDTLSDSTLLAESDTAAGIYSTGDSMLCHGAADSISAHLVNCGNGSPVIATRIKNILDSLCAAHVVANGNYTPEQVRYAIINGGASINDLCNPYLVGYSISAASSSGTPGQDCNSDSFYVSTDDFLNDDAVIGAFRHATAGTTYLDTLSPLDNLFENYIWGAMGGNAYISMYAGYDPVNTLYTLYVYNTPHVPAWGPATDTVKIYLRGTGSCGAVFSGGAGDSISVTSVDCINSFPQPSATGLINELSFIATVTNYSGSTATSCRLLGWADSVQTMGDMSNPVGGCIPCTQMRTLYTQFTDSITAWGMKGIDHPFYEEMLLHFMNYNLGQQYSSDQYETFIQSCALADSMRLPLYVGYANLVFNNPANADSFMSMLDRIDPDYSFDNSYRDSASTGLMTISVDLNAAPWEELYRYKSAIESWPTSLPGMPYTSVVADVVDTGLSYLQGDTVVGFVYTNPGVYLTTSAVFGTGGTLQITDSTNTKKVWMGTHFVSQKYYLVTCVPGVTPPYEISRGVYELQRYIYNNNLPATFISNYQSTINNDYFKSQKQAYLHYTYNYQQLPPYNVLDSVQANYLVARIPGYASDQVTYSQPFNPNIITNLYLSDNTMTNNYFDTLTHILHTVADSNMIMTGAICFDTNRVRVTHDSTLYAYRCSDGTYWYRYFGYGDTMYNVYLSMPPWIASVKYKYYRIISVGPPAGIVPALGDSTSRFFTLNMVSSTMGDTIQARGMTNFVIAKNLELDNVLLGNPITEGTAPAPSDTFENCERDILRSAVSQGIVSYNNYIDSFRSAITGGFMAYMLDSVKEQLLLGYFNQEFNYTLYYYDRANNLIATVPPAGVAPLDTSLIASVDTARTSDTVNTALLPSHTKMSLYGYNTINQVAEQTTPDAGATQFFYDAAGRLIFSQNANQRLDGKFTYNLYDPLNRVIETGEGLFGLPYFSQFVSDGSALPAAYYVYPPPAGTTTGHTYSPYPPFIYNMINGGNSFSQMPYDSVYYFIHSYDRDDVVMTIYDTAATNLATVPGMSAQQNLRKRVACVKYFEQLSVADAAYAHYNYATHYSYDIDGNVNTLVQDFPSLAYLKQRYKRVDYDYDLISGKVNMLSYNRSFADQYYQRYSYDDDNRITLVETSADGYIWKKDASYVYYEHGPLARIDLGALHVQGIDYAYTLQGWLKIVNSDTLNSTMDMGQDGTVTINAKDAVAYSIDYFKNDYKPITSWGANHVVPDSLSLYNGNIARQTMNIEGFQRLNKLYIYDQLNRIHSASYAAVSPVDNTLQKLTDYRNNYSYDPDGNITSLLRYGNNLGSGAQLMDSLTYHYGTGAGGFTLNQLEHLEEDAPDVYTNDIHYSPYNPNFVPDYEYDAVGNMIRDMKSGQDSIEWNLYNKVTYTHNVSDSNWMDFEYDGAGNRVAKYFTQSNGTGSTSERNDYYVHDAQGNILAIYHETAAYQTETIPYVTWVHDWALGSGGVSAIGYLTSFVLPTFGGSPDFWTGLRPYFNASFRSLELGRPVSYFMTGHPAMYDKMVGGDDSYVVPLANEEMNGKQKIIGPSIYQMALKSPQDFITMLSTLYSMQGPIQQEVLNLVCASGNSSIMPTLAPALGVKVPQGDSCTGIADSIVTYIPKSQAVATNLNKLLRSKGANLQAYAYALATDNIIYSNLAVADPQGTYIAQLANAIDGYGVKKDVINYFDTYSGATAILNHVATKDQQLKLCYNTDMPGFLTALDSTWGAYIEDSAMASMPSLPAMSSYLASAASSLSLPGMLTASTSSIMVNAEQSRTFGLAEHDIYGSSRLGVKKYWPGQVGATFNYVTHTADTIRLWRRQPWYSEEYQDVIQDTMLTPYGNSLLTPFVTQHITGQKQYELTDHLGDVLATVSDARQPDTPKIPLPIRFYMPVVQSASDYYPFGMLMPGRYTSDSATYCTTMTETVLAPTGGTREIMWWGTGRAHSFGDVELAESYTALIITTPIPLTVASGVTDTVQGLIPGYSQEIDVHVQSATGEYIAQVTNPAGDTVLGTASLSGFGSGSGTHAITFTPTSTSVKVIVSAAYPMISGPSTPGYRHIEITGLTVPAFGLAPTNVVAQVCSEDIYEYGFNGKLKDNEWAGVGNHLDYGFRQYDSRIGRFISVDPLTKKFPFLTPYQFASNTPIWATDLDGREARIYTEITGTGHTFITVGSGKDLTLYTYGRYAGGNAWTAGTTGPGVLIKYTGEQASNYLTKELYHMNVKAFEVMDANQVQVKGHLDNLYNSSAVHPTTDDKNVNEYGHIVNTYTLFGNNCTTTSSDALKSGGTGIFKVDGIFSNYQEDFTIPTSLQDYLTNKAKSGSNVKDVTGALKSEYSNTGNQKALKSAGSSGETSGSSGTGSGSSANSSSTDASSSGSGSGSSSDNK